MRLLFIISLLLCFASAACKKPAETNAVITESMPTQQSQQTELNQTAAIDFAEKFIERNGYTDISPDREHLVDELVEWESNVNEILRMRHNSLENKAFGISRGRKSGSEGWTVVFRYKNLIARAPSKNGRAVTFNLDGSDPRVEHADFILAKATTKL